MTIGICDDETYILKQLEKAINSYFTTKEVPLEILIFHSGEEVIANTVQMDMLFLDIEMTGIDGIATGEMLREKQKCCKIVMATGKVERFKEAFRIQAFRFITKPFQKEEIEEALSALLETQCGTSEIEVWWKRNPHTFRQQDISFIRAIGGEVELSIKGKRYRKDVALSELENELDETLFFRINRQYIVNLGEITKQKANIVMVAGEELKVSVRKKKDFEKACLRYKLRG